jgi:hypothetical protein
VSEGPAAAVLVLVLLLLPCWRQRACTGSRLQSCYVCPSGHCMTSLCALLRCAERPRCHRRTLSDIRLLLPPKHLSYHTTHTGRAS